MEYSKIFTVDYFIRKFSTIPDRLWTMGNYEEGERKCAYGHCGLTTCKEIPEAVSLNNLFKAYLNVNVFWVNDGCRDEYKEMGKTPRARILAALQRIKLIQQNETQTPDQIIQSALTSCAPTS